MARLGAILQGALAWGLPALEAGEKPGAQKDEAETAARQESGRPSQAKPRSGAEIKETRRRAALRTVTL
jgi:hypothetical protein